MEEKPVKPISSRAELKNETDEDLELPGQEPKIQQVRKQQNESAMRETEDLSGDFISFGEANDTLGVDSIIEIVRKEVLEKQQLFMQQEIAKIIENEEDKDKFLKQDITQIRTYLASTEGRNNIAELWKNPDIQKRIHEIEKAGYQKVKSANNFSAINWEQNTNGSRTTSITNKDGVEVCKLTENIVASQKTHLLLNSGETKEVQGYRHIAFPLKLKVEEYRNFSMALKDENGHNMPKNGELDFTVHYDSSGELSEMSAPSGIKFMGEGKDAIGYIEREGKIYTLPVTADTYYKMVEQVKSKNGHFVDSSKRMEASSELSKDMVTGPEHQQPEISKNTSTDQEQQPTEITKDTSTPPVPEDRVQSKVNKDAQQETSASPIEAEVKKVASGEVSARTGNPVSRKVRGLVRDIKQKLVGSGGKTSPEEIPLTELASQVEKPKLTAKQKQNQDQTQQGGSNTPLSNRPRANTR